LPENPPTTFASLVFFATTEAPTTL
jgi:hypothetical protein